MRRFLPALVACALIATVAGCGDGDDRIVRTGPDPARLQADGKLDADPQPLTLAAVDRQPTGSPRQAVLQLIFWGQWGSLPNVVGFYDPAIQRRFGVERIAQAFSYVRPGLLGASPRIAGVITNPLGAFVAVDMYSRFAPPIHDSFLLRKRAGQWVIVYDTLLERSLAGAAADDVINGARSPSEALRQQAELAGERAARDYRSIALVSTFRRSFREQGLVAPRGP